MVYLEALKKGFKNRNILNINYICFNPGINLILGINGSGKSTLFNIIYGKLEADSGRVLFKDSILKRAYLKKELVTYLPQDQLIFPLFKVRDVIETLDIEMKNRDFLLNRFSKFLKRRIGSLSGGERRLFEIYTVLLSRSKLIILDEPFKALEPKGVEEIIPVINKTDKTVILSTHNYSLVRTLKKRIFLLNSGDIKAVDEKKLYEIGYLH